MKRILIIASLVALAAAPVFALSVVGSKHDMISTGFYSATGGAPTEVCIFCHTPHGANTFVGQAPLWNNNGTLANADIGSLYNSATMNATYATDQRTAVNATDARLCLACHDGSVGEPVNGPNAGILNDNTLPLSANAVIGTDLSNDHPIGMDLTSNPETIDPYLRTLAEIDGVLRSDALYGANKTMWCSSCHDVHNNENTPFLRISNSSSNLCKACHIK